MEHQLGLVTQDEDHITQDFFFVILLYDQR